MQGIKFNFFKVSNVFFSLSHTQKLLNPSVCALSLSSVKNLVYSSYFCHLLPTVANYCTNSLQHSHTQTHTFANTYTVHRSIHKYHVTGQWVPSPEVRPAAWLDSTRDGQIGNRLFLTQFVR